MLEFPNNEMFSAEAVEQELKSGSEDREGITGISAKEKKDVIQATFKFDDIHDMDSDAYQIPVADYAVLEDQRLEGLQLDGEKVEFTKKSSEILLKLPGDLGDFDQAKISVGGKIVAHSDGLDLVKKDTVEVHSNRDLYVVYAPKAGVGKAFSGGILLLIIAGGVFYFMKKQRMKEEHQLEGEIGDEHA